MTSKHFNIKELVSRKTYEEYGTGAWRLFDPKVIEVIDWIRDQLNAPITVNNWCWGGNFENRGYRDENCTVGAVKSAHKQGMALDFDVKGMSSYEVRQWLFHNAEDLPHPIRCEEGVNWVHIDTRAVSGKQIYFFKP